MSSKLTTRAGPANDALRQAVRRLAIRTHLYPHISLNRMPFKTYEFRELMRHCHFRKTDHVLDLGCGTGTQTILVGRRCAKIVGVDTDAHWIERARAYATRFEGEVDAQFLCGPVEEQYLRTESFDKILSFCVIEHIPNYPEVLLELHRLLKPGGRLILSADSLAGIEDPDLIEKHRTDNSVHEYFQPESFRRALTTAGFEVDSLYPIFCSDFARRTFEDGIRREFSYGYVEAMRTYAQLRFHEAVHRDRDQGLFLVAACHK